MLTTPQNDRIARKCAAVLTKTIDAFPDLLAQVEPEVAAAIVADLLKALLVRPLPEPSPGAALADVIRLAAAEEAAEQQAAGPGCLSQSPFPNS
jgi:hypothetical protein